MPPPNRFSSCHVDEKHIRALITDRRARLQIPLDVLAVQTLLHSAGPYRAVWRCRPALTAHSARALHLRCAAYAMPSLDTALRIRDLCCQALAHVVVTFVLSGDETNDRATIQVKDPKAPKATLRCSGTSHMLIISTGTHTTQHACTVLNQLCCRRPRN